MKVTLFRAIVFGAIIPIFGIRVNAAGNSFPSEPYVWKNVVIGGGGFVDGIVFHPAAKNLAYARTDVGGAYRWDDQSQQWVALNDWLSADQNNYAGIESIGLDMTDSNRVYLAAGTYSRGGAAILRSEDRGNTFKVTEVSFRMGGNEDGRSNGERLAVDPHDGRILFFGSRRDGLWRSDDRALTWKRVESFTNIGTVQPYANAVTTNSNVTRRRRLGGNTAYGIVSVVFDARSGTPGKPTPLIYMAVSTPGTNFYRSDDAGEHWQPVPGQPTGLRPNHVVESPEGVFYLTYSSVPGPNYASDGEVWKFDPREGEWSNISPEKPEPGARLGWGYGSVAIDAQHPSTVVVSTIDRWKLKDEIFRSTDGGASWKGILKDGGKLDYSFAAYTRDRTPHWMGSVAINPNDSDQIIFGTGYGIWTSTNATAADSGRHVTWVFQDKALEETVPLALISPPQGAHLLSGVGDIDGFRHDDLTVSPLAGTFNGPHFGNTESLAFAGKNPDVIVRCGSGGSEAVHAAFSADGGASWERFESEPVNGVEGGSIAISADAQTIVWTPRRSDAFLTRDKGRKWIACKGLSPNLRVIADPVDPQIFYAYNAGTGKVLVSTNGAADFFATAAIFQPANEFGSGFEAAPSTTPGMTGDLWLVLRGDGLFHSTDGGKSFTPLPAVQSAWSLGFGMAAPGMKFPALYLAGEVGGRRAVFRSDDSGATWIYINDDQHQFGSISHVTGDPRIFGRLYFATGGRGIVYGSPEKGAP